MKELFQMYPILILGFHNENCHLISNLKYTRYKSNYIHLVMILKYQKILSINFWLLNLNHMKYPSL